MVVNQTISYNASADALSDIASISGIGITITAVVFILTLLLLFLFIKNFRRFLIGAGINGVLFGTFLFSRYIGKSTASGNIAPIKWFGYVGGFIILSIIVGIIISKTKIGKKIDKFIDDIDSGKGVENGLNKDKR